MINLNKVYDYLAEKKEPQDFYEIWNVFHDKDKASDNQKNEEMSKFYFNFINDRRFVTVGKNLWDIKKNQPFDDFQHNVSSVYDESDLFHDEEPEEVSLQKGDEVIGLDNIDANNEKEDDDTIVLEDEVLGEENIIKDASISKIADMNEEVQLDDILVDQAIDESPLDPGKEIILDANDEEEQ